MKRARGLTLIEMLVSLVILGAVMGLVAQAVAQVERIVRVADDAQRDTSERWGRGWALQLLIANLVVPREAQGDALKGDADRMEGYSTSPVTGSDNAVHRFELRLVASERHAGDTDLIARSEEGNATMHVAGEVVATFPGRVGFEYLDSRGQWAPFWPSASSTDLRPEGAPVTLPSAIRVVDLGGGRLHIAYPIMASGSFQQRESHSPFTLGR